MKILITGGAGFIGSNVADAYLKAGHKVIIVDNLVTGKRRNINPEAVFYEMDICDENLSQIFDKEKPDIVNHHAAQISVPLSVENPLMDITSNVYGWVNVLQNCINSGVKKVIYISSGGAIYGEAEEYPTTETYNPKPLSIYAINKSVGEDYLYFYRYQYGLEYTILRYANVYGPRQISSGEAGVVSLFTEKLLKNILIFLVLFSSVFVGSFQLKAQNDMIIHGMNIIPQSHYSNPAFMPQCRWHIGMPVLSSLMRFSDSLSRCNTISAKAMRFISALACCAFSNESFFGVAFFGFLNAIESSCKALMYTLQE